MHNRNDKAHSRPETISPERYQAGKNSGWSVERTANQIAEDGIDDISAIRLIRQLYGIDLVSAKEAWMRAKHHVTSLQEHQANLLDALKETIEPKKSKESS